MNIGIIGAGALGCAIAKLWADAGHTVMLSSRHPEQLGSRVAELGPLASAGTVAEASQFGEILLFAVPYETVDEATTAIRTGARGKLVIDATNPVFWPDGGVMELAIGDDEASGHLLAQRLPQARIVKAFATLKTGFLEEHGQRQGTRVAVALAGDDKVAKRTVGQLIRDAGFEPVDVGSLAASRPLDPPSPIWNVVLTADELRERVFQFRGA